jgi:hypothetical protein
MIFTQEDYEKFKNNIRKEIAKECEAAIEYEDNKGRLTMGMGDELRCTDEILRLRRINEGFIKKLGGLCYLPEIILQDIIDKEDYIYRELRGHIADLEVEKLEKEIEDIKFMGTSEDE